MVAARRRWGLTLKAAFLVALASPLLAYGAAGAQAGVGAAGAEAAAVVSLFPEAAVQGPRVYLGEIARIESADPELKRALETLDVWRAPVPGQTIYMNEPRIRVAFRRERLPDQQIVFRDGAESVAITLRQQEREVLAAAVDLPRHEPLSPDVVEVVAQPWEPGPVEPVTPERVPLEQLGHWRTSRPVRAGTPLDFRWIEPRPDVAKGQPVLVTLRYGPVEVVAEGALEEDARVGGTVRVRVEGVEKVLQGVLVAPDAVEIRPPVPAEGGTP